MDAEIIRYGNSGKIAPPTIPPATQTPEQRAAQELLNKAAEEKLAQAGRAHWHVAHTRRHWTPETFVEWVAGIPRYGCSCQRDAEAYIEANPPPLGDDDAMFEWFVQFHDDVNAKLHRDVFGLPAARELYGR